jgi:hypothetical protein
MDLEGGLYFIVNMIAVYFIKFCFGLYKFKYAFVKDFDSAKY